MQRYFAEKKEAGFLFLTTSDQHHIKNVMRMSPSDEIECVYEEKLYICKLDETLSTCVEIIEEKADYHESNWEVTIAVGLVKEQKFDLILQKLTELGISRIIPVAMERSIVKLPENKIASKQDRWQKICKEAAEQSKRNKIPEVTAPVSLRQLANLDNQYKFICSTNNATNLTYDYLQKMDENARLIFVIGPEGGISPNEEEKLISFGYLPVSLGNRIMRVETATIYIASILNFCSMR